MPEQWDAEQLLTYCQYDPSTMSPTARRKKAQALREKYGITGIQGPRKGLRYSPAEVRRKVPFVHVPTIQTT